MTIYPKQLGVWKRQFETSNIIEIITDDELVILKTKLFHIREFIKKVANQEDVLITIKDVDIL